MARWSVDREVLKKFRESRRLLDDAERKLNPHARKQALAKASATAQPETVTIPPHIAAGSQELHLHVTVAQGPTRTRTIRGADGLIQYTVTEPIEPTDKGGNA